MSTINDALNILKGANWRDLTHGVTPDIPRFGAFPSLQSEAIYTVQKDGFFVNKTTFVTQYGTHIDAPCHFSVGKRTLDELDIRDFVLPLYVIDHSADVEKNPDFILKKEHILEFESKHGCIQAGSFVAFASGWSKRWGDQEAMNNKDDKGVSHTPGWSIEAIEFLIKERNITAIGHETLDTDAGIDVAKNKHLLSELFLLENEHFQVELLNDLVGLPATGSMIIIGVPKFVGYPGFPVRAFAIY